MKSLAKALSYDEASLVINSLLNESSWVNVKGCRTDVLKSIEETDKYPKRGWVIHSSFNLKMYGPLQKYATNPPPP